MEPEPCPEEIAAVAAPHLSNLAGWLLLGIVMGVLVAELILIMSGKPTISQWVSRKTRGRPKLRILGLGLIGLLLIHLAFGGPL